VVVVGASVVVVVGAWVVLVGFSVVVVVLRVVVVAGNASSLELTCFASSVLVNGAVTATSNTKPAAICPHSGHARYLRHARAGSLGPSDGGSAP
jgi:hypothetical protein